MSDTPEQETKPENKATEFDRRIKSLQAQLTEKDNELEIVANSVLDTIPENLKALIPEDLSPAAKMKWFNKAKETGIFKSSVPETDTKKPGITPQQVNPDDLPPIARMAYGYK